MKNTVITERIGLLFNYVEDDISVWGDAAPFPGLHHEKIENILHWLKTKIFLIENLNEIEDLKTPFPSVDFAISSCILQWQAKKKGIDLRHFLSISARDTIPVNALITGTGEDALKSLNQAQKKGYKYFKVKVGRQSIESDIALLKKICESLEIESWLRLDANQAWTFEEAVRFFSEFKNFPIEYIEEPLKKSKDIPKLHKEFEIPIALDESLYDQDPEFLDFFSEFDAIVLKPSRIGSIKKTLYWIDKAKYNQIKTIISSSFDSGVGLRVCAEIAAAKTTTASGLDTFSWFKKDVTKPFFNTFNGRVDFAKYSINTDLIKKIDL